MAAEINIKTSRKFDRAFNGNAVLLCAESGISDDLVAFRFIPFQLLRVESKYPAAIAVKDWIG